MLVAQSLRMCGVIPSGPGAFCGWRSLSSFSTPSVVTLILWSSGVRLSSKSGRLLVYSLVKTDLNGLLRTSALSLGLAAIFTIVSVQSTYSKGLLMFCFDKIPKRFCIVGGQATPDDIRNITFVCPMNTTVYTATNSLKFIQRFPSSSCWGLGISLLVWRCCLPNSRREDWSLPSTRHEHD